LHEPHWRYFTPIIMVASSAPGAKKTVQPVRCVARVTAGFHTQWARLASWSKSSSLASIRAVRDLLWQRNVWLTQVVGLWRLILASLSDHAWQYQTWRLVGESLQTTAVSRTAEASVQILVVRSSALCKSGCSDCMPLPAEWCRANVERCSLRFNLVYFLPFHAVFVLCPFSSCFCTGCMSRAWWWVSREGFATSMSTPRFSRLRTSKTRRTLSSTLASVCASFTGLQTKYGDPSSAQSGAVSLATTAAGAFCVCGVDVVMYFYFGGRIHAKCCSFGACWIVA